MAACLFRACGRQLLAVKSSGGIAKSCVPMSTVKIYKEMDEYWKKNRQLERPLSPHLTIYKPQLTSMLSLCHRLTGIAMAVTITSVSITLMCVPYDYTTILSMVKDLQVGPALITAAKYLLAFPVCYHYLNGIRHLAWDWALGFGLQFLYKSGWMVFAMAWLVATMFVFFPVSKE